ncbi:MAG: family 78 glycoside hydrolase catalytic domain [Armatimonadota bacterium]
MNLWTLVLLCCVLLSAAGVAGPADARDGDGAIRPVALTCEYAVNPLGVDSPAPALGWQLRAADPKARGLSQSAYQVQVATSPAQLRAGKADVWDSGRVESAESVQVPYGGRPLRSGERVYWRVRAWDTAGAPSPWSEAAWWEMGLLRPEDWSARWIVRANDTPPADPYGDDPAPLLRREFTLKAKPARARVYVSGLGYYELRLNGERVGDRVLDPAWTTYSERVFYSVYDVTDRLQRGRNALGAMLGGGWYDPLPLPLFNRFNPRDVLPVGPMRLVLQLEVEYPDGSRERVVTDDSWKAAEGPVVRNSVYLGEHYDARREQRGWDRPGFDDSAWGPVALASGELGPLQAQPLEPIRLARTVETVALSEPQPGVYIFDLGQNLAGWATLRVKGPAGTQVRMRYGELLHKDGTLNPMTSVTGQLKQGRPFPNSERPPIAWQEDRYVLRGGGMEEYTPRFTFHGFRYVEVTGYPGKPERSAVRGHLLHSAVASAGDFSCSSELFNRIQEMVRWTQLSNMFSVQSDCPHREKLGYGGDIVAASEMGMLNFDMARFYAKTVLDFADAQRPNGGFTETAPYLGIADEGLGGGAGPVGWGTAHPLLLAQLHQYYGNRRLLAEQYDRAAAWMKLLQERAVNGILDNGISDHESLVPKPRALTGTAFYYYNARLLERMARVLGKEADAQRYASLAGEIAEAFNRRFRRPVRGLYDSGTQACQAFALYMDLVPPEDRELALQHLVSDVMTVRGGHLSTGIFGTKYLLLSLSDLGRADVAYTIAGQRTFPGWGHMLENGATTLWEHWELSDNTFSHNHPMFGTVSEWFFKAVAGIQPHPDAVGFDRVVIRPQPGGGLTWARGEYRSVRGLVSSRWKREGDRVSLEVEVPVNASALVYVPARRGEEVLEGGRPAAEAPGVRLLRWEGSAAVYEVGSGRYRFSSRGIL